MSLDAEQDLYSSMPRTSRHIGRDARERVRRWQERTEPEGLSTGFVTLDDGGIRLFDNELVVLAARPQMGKCLGKGTGVLMFDGRVLPVESIVVGDKLMGPDSTPRTVLSLASGVDEMWRVEQQHGISYSVNRSHIIALSRSKKERAKWSNGDKIEIPVYELLKKPKSFFDRFKGYKVGVEFSEKRLGLEPYFMGLWLGDGSSSSAAIFNEDEEVISYLHEYAARRFSHVVVGGGEGKCASYNISSGRSRADRDDSIMSQLNHMGLLNNKHIPEPFLINSRWNRLLLLAGLIDSDGHCHRTNGHESYEITLKNERLLRQVKFLCDSLGYRTTVTKRITRCQTGAESTVWRLQFNGDIWEIPVLVNRKRARKVERRNDLRHSGIKLTFEGLGAYYGFELDGDGLFLLEDMTVTHNTSVSMQMARSVAQHLKDTGDPGCVLVYSCEMTAEQLLLRMAASQAGVNLQAARLKKVSDEDYDRLNAALTQIEALPIVINDATSPDTYKIDAEVAALKDRGRPVRFLVADYLELLGDSTATGREQDNVRIARIVTRCKALAKKWHVPFLMLSQVTRETEAAGGTMMPTMKDMRGSAAIEQTADQIWVLMRPQYYLQQGIPCACELASDAKDTIYFGCVKSRNGAGGLTFRFLWSGYRTSMMDMHADARRKVTWLAVRQPSEFAKSEPL